MRKTSMLAPMVAIAVAAGLSAAAQPQQTRSAGAPTGTDSEERPAIVVQSKDPLRSLSPVLQGSNVNIWYGSARGLWDAAAQAPNADAAAKTAQAGVGLLRFPGGSSADLYDWKRSIGPHDERVCQTEGVGLDGKPETNYGPDEFMTIARTVGAQPEIMVPFPNASPTDVANWFEYMNAPLGTNPNGGVAWAEVRAANGSPEPYGVTRWEIGNEQYLPWAAFWMDSTDIAHRLDQYINGDQIDFVDVPLGRGCDFSATTTTRFPGQTFYFEYRLIKDGTTPVVKVGGRPWTEVADLSAAGPTDRVYQLDRSIGAVRFGDGVHGAIPGRGQTVTASYTFQHKGFVAVYDALKSTAAQIGQHISVCASWSPVAARGGPPEDIGAPSFAQEMSRLGLSDRYDCVATHPYTSLGTDFWPWTTAQDAYQAHMAGDQYSDAVVASLAADLKANSTNHAFVAITEMGALWFGAAPEDVAAMPKYSATLTHALYMASQWLGYAPMDVGWIIGNDLVPLGLRGTLGGVDTGFVYGAEARTREALKPFFESGSTLVGSEVQDQPQLTANDGTTWPALVVGAATGGDGALRIAVVNRDPGSPRSWQVVPAGFPHDPVVETATVHGASISSFDDNGTLGGDNTVELTRATMRTPGRGAFSYTFPPSSVTVLTLRPGTPAG